MREPVSDAVRTCPGGGGYGDPRYVESLRAYGDPVWLPACDGWLLSRPIPGSDRRDAMGPYPLFSCADWSRLGIDLDVPPGGLVSITFVPDPMGGFDPDLHGPGLDVCVPFKEHHVVSLGAPLETFVSRHHLRNVARARRTLRVEEAPNPADRAEEWTSLYGEVADRYGMEGIRRFSAGAFGEQLRLPGMRMFLAMDGPRIAGAQLWLVHDRVAYNHLMATTAEGLRLGAAFALVATAIDELAADADVIELGGAAGADPPPDDGLARFKRGWATGTRTAYLCGKIVDPEAYQALTARRGTGAASFFPAYRAGELG